MWLLTVKIWWASLDKAGKPKRESIKEDIEAVVVRGSLSDGICRLLKYALALNVRSGGSSATKCRLIAATSIPDDTDVEALMRVGVLELDDSTVDGMGNR